MYQLSLVMQFAPKRLHRSLVQVAGSHQFSSATISSMSMTHTELRESTSSVPLCPRLSAVTSIANVACISYHIISYHILSYHIMYRQQPSNKRQGAKTIKKNTNSTQNKSETHHAKQYEVTSFLSTDCELSTETCSKNVYSLGPRCSHNVDMNNKGIWHFAFYI